MIHIYTHTWFIIVTLDNRFPLLRRPSEEFQLGVCVTNNCLEEVVEAMICFENTGFNIIAHEDKRFTLVTPDLLFGDLTLTNVDSQSLCFVFTEIQVVVFRVCRFSKIFLLNIT